MARFFRYQQSTFIVHNDAMQIWRYSLNSMQSRCAEVLIVLAVCHLNTAASGQELICGNNYNLLVCRDSVIRIWGTNEYGILAEGSTDTSVHSNIIDTMGQIKSVWPGKYHVVVQRQNGTFWTWGRRFLT
ncbi:MAG: hypothetical protein IPM83_12815 [Ignavibacteria bacterium]|nr:hypothetical protein [Ignavibacteria bacterium]